MRGVIDIAFTLFIQVGGNNQVKYAEHNTWNHKSFSQPDRTQLLQGIKKNKCKYDGRNGT